MACFSFLACFTYSQNFKPGGGWGGTQHSYLKSRALHIRYFFITDQVKNGNVVIEYCPTENMVADFYTKPLQGKLFYKFRDQILGLAPMDDIHIHRDHRSVLDNKKTVKIGKAKKAKNVSKLSWADVVKGKTISK